MAFGTAAKVEDPAEKEAGLNAFVDRVYPGRTALIRPINTQELKATTLLGMTIEEASAKVREGGPVDDEEDYAADCWAGIVPITPHIGAVVPDPRLKPGGAARTRHRRHPRADPIARRGQVPQRMPGPPERCRSGSGA